MEILQDYLHPKDKICWLILVTGYLGAGKTTLIQYILKGQNKYKVAIIQNEFSDEMGIESPLITDSVGKIFDKFYELPNGCICCSAKKELQTAIEYLITSEKYELDFILVETNGLADPSSTIKMFWVGEELKFPSKLRLVYSLVAAHTFEKNAIDNEIFLKQLIFADVILINHIDKVSEDKLKDIEAKLTQINPTAVLRKSTYCQTDIDEIFDTEGFIMKLKDRDDLSNLPVMDHEHHHADKDIQFIVLEFQDKQFDARKLEEKIGFLLWEHPDEVNIMRVKGIFAVSGSEKKFSVQGVDDIFEIKEAEVSWNNDRKVSKFLLVGTKIDKEKITSLFEEAIVT